jgi:hypothetical protein
MPNPRSPEPVSRFRTLESPEPVRAYLALKAEARRIEAAIKEAEAEVWNAVDEEGGAVVFDGCTLEACVSKTYRYSEAVTAAEAELRALKAAERDAGTATVERATGYVRVTPPKTDAALLLDVAERRALREASGGAAEGDGAAAPVPVLDGTPF